MYLWDYENHLDVIQGLTSHPLLLLPLLEALLRAKQNPAQRYVVLLLSLKVLRGFMQEAGTWELPWSHTLLLLGVLASVSKAASSFVHDAGYDASGTIRGLVTLSALLIRMLPVAEVGGPRAVGKGAVEDDGGGEEDGIAKGGAMAGVAAAGIGTGAAAMSTGEASGEEPAAAAISAIGVAMSSEFLRKGYNEEQQQQQAAAAAATKEGASMKQGYYQGLQRRWTLHVFQENTCIQSPLKAAALAPAAAAAPAAGVAAYSTPAAAGGGAAGAAFANLGGGQEGTASATDALVPEPCLEEQQQAIAYVSCRLLAVATKLISHSAMRQATRMPVSSAVRNSAAHRQAAQGSAGGSADVMCRACRDKDQKQQQHQKHQKQQHEEEEKAEGNPDCFNHSERQQQQQELPVREQDCSTPPHLYPHQQEEHQQQHQKLEQEPHEQQQKQEPPQKQQQRQGQVVHGESYHNQEQNPCTCCSSCSEGSMSMVIQGFMDNTMDVVVRLGKRTFWPAMLYCEDCCDMPSFSNSSSSGGRNRGCPLGWPGGKNQKLEGIVVPFTLLPFLAQQLHTLVTCTFPSQLGMRTLKQLVKPQKMSWEADWMFQTVPVARQALMAWAESGGRLQPDKMWGGEWLRVPLLVASALLMAVPVDFACNNPGCESLDGPWELGLVSQRAKVVCGGCGVARYCSRDCQGKHWKWHVDTCRHLQGCVRGR
jgi:hypothetical protein